MTNDRDPEYTPADPDEEFHEDEEPRSIFSAPWFRGLVVVLVIVAIGAVAVPWIADTVNPTSGAAPPTTVASSSAVAPPPKAAPAPPTATPATPATAAPAAAPAAPSVSTATPAPTAAPAATPSDRAATAAPKAASPAPAPAATAAPATARPTTAAPSAPPPAWSATPPRAAPATAKPAAETTKSAADAKAPAEAAKPRERTTAAPVASARARASEGGEWFVQVGAFKDQATARRTASRLREMNYPVEESVKRLDGGGSAAPAPRPAVRPTAAGGPDRYDVLVSGGSASDINARLAAKGLAAEPSTDGVRIRPSLSLRDAVALSKDLGTDGFKVQVRRASVTAAAPESAPVMAARSAEESQTLHRVRVGGYADRAAAQRVQRALADKGFQPFIARGRE